MTPTLLRRLLAPTLFIVALLFGAANADSPSGDTSELDRVFQRSSLQIATPDARLHSFHIWIADDDTLRARGLMFVTKMEDDKGMLFIYPRPQPIAMWMKNTHIPLDMLFVRADGRIERVVENTVPMSTQTIESGAPVLAVIELNGGAARKMNIRAGAQVIHPTFAPKP